jgi:polysaccharide export outer membrane protein
MTNNTRKFNVSFPISFFDANQNKRSSKQLTHTKTIFIIIIPLLICFFSSCISSKQVKYFQAINQDSITVKTNETEYTIQPLDLLYIKVNSLNEKTRQFFDPRDKDYGGIENEQSLYLKGFEVGINGYLKLPYLDSLLVLGKTLSDTKNMISEKLKEYIDDAVVNIRLISFKVCVFGEVSNPGTFSFYNTRVTIFDAVAAARPTDFANKKNVVITRLLSNGELSIRRIDLTKQEITKSDYYYLKPHDQIYFEPLKVKQYGFTNAPYGLILSTITVALLIINNLK